MDIIFAGGKFRAKSKFAKVAKIYSTQKIGVMQYRDLVENVSPLLATVIPTLTGVICDARNAVNQGFGESFETAVAAQESFNDNFEVQTNYKVGFLFTYTFTTGLIGATYFAVTT